MEEFLTEWRRLLLNIKEKLSAQECVDCLNVISSQATEAYNESVENYNEGAE